MSELKDNQAYIGLNLQSTPSQVKKGQLTWAVNAVIEGVSGESVTYQNEEGNNLCVSFPEGYRVVQGKQIENFLLFFLANPVTGGSEIGKVIDCEYITVVNTPCLKFSIDQPIHKIVYKKTSNTQEIYWANKGRYYIDLLNLPFLEIQTGVSCDNIITTEIDCNKLLIQPALTIPTIKYVGIDSGNLTEGTYQFAVQYANALGDGYSKYYSITNPISIFDPFKISGDFNTPTNKSITFSIDNIDDSGIYDYINIAVIATINNTPKVSLIDTKRIIGTSLLVNYTGEDVSPINLDISDIFTNFPIYNEAEDVFTVQDVLGWSGLTTKENINYQSIWNNVKLQWQSYKIRADKAYKNSLTTANLRSCFRDEIYSYDGVFFKKDGSQSNRFPIASREANEVDLEIIENTDTLQGTICDPIEDRTLRWKKYNTAINLGKAPEYVEEDCYEGPYEYGEFAYWESSEVYPCNEAIWGPLAGKPIRHHKYPDCGISPHHDGEYVYPIGVRISADQVLEAIRNSNLTKEQKEEIVGFKIVRGNRATNKTIIAKGLIYNVGKYRKNAKDYFYPNYPFNDLRKDPFLAIKSTGDDSGKNEAYRLDGFSTSDSKKRFTFHSPDTHFYQPTLGSQLKLETLEVGKAQSHFVQVQNHARYKFLTTGSYLAVLGVSVVVGVLSATLGLSNNLFNGVAAFASFDSILGLLDKTLPKINFAYQFNSLGRYTKSLPIAEGNTLRDLDIAQYILPGMVSVGDTATINNYQRESSVYLRTTTEIGNPSVQDQSRWILGDNECDVNTIREHDISAYYASIKRNIPDVYGTIHSYDTVDTGFYQPINVLSSERLGYKSVFGGDCFINKFALKRKMPFFLDNRVSPEGTNRFPDEADIMYNELENVAHPIFWLSTDYRSVENPDGIEDFSDIDEDSKSKLRKKRDKIFATIKQFFGVKINNFDCKADKFFYQNGKFYLFAYGVPYFFVESEVNVDARKATNNKDGDFFPHVGEDIPDDWLQETKVSIQLDNTYTYNKTFSKQNKENFFTSLLESDPLVYYYPNKAIYSDQNVDGTNYKRNNFLIYRPVSYFDFPLNYGKLISVDGINDGAILARFEESSKVYNALLTINTSNPKSFWAGNDSLFRSSPPLSFAETDLGYNGTQHKFFLRTEHGNVSVDAKRGKVFLLSGTQAQDITSSKFFVEAFFKNNLPFKILNYFPDVPVDNHFNNLGITGVFDSRYNRLILTKLDYTPLDPAIKYAKNKFTLNGTEVQLTDPLHFENQSFTISFDFDNGCWISLHSYVPNYYVGGHNTFYSGVRDLWKHFSTEFNKFYGVIEPYIIQYPFTDQKDSILQSITDYTKSFKNTDNGIISSDNYFNKAVISNNEQTSGVLNLIKKPVNKPLAYLSYPKYNVDSKDILYTKSGSFFHYNGFWDIVKNPSQVIFFQNIDKDLNPDNLDYSNKIFRKYPIRGTEASIRHILDDKSDTKLISQFILTKNQPSYK